MRGKTACFSGHRIISPKDLATLLQRLDEHIAALIQQGVAYFGSGYARGFDMLAAQAVIRARETNRAVKLIAVLPCSDQSVKWPAADQQLYQHLLAAADKVVYVSDQPYEDGCMAQRNLHLVLHSIVCVTYKKHERSGTAQTTRMAAKHGLHIINLAN